MTNISPTQFESLIEQATSESIPNGDIDLIKSLEISDVIRSKSLPTQQCLKVFVKRVVLVNTPPINVNAQLSIWRLVEICFKNGGDLFIKELISNEFIKLLETSIVKSYHNGFEDREIFELLSQILYDMKNYCHDLNKINYPYGQPEKIWNKLQTLEDIKFPTEKLIKNDISTFDSKQPAEWTDSDSCMICSSKFSMFNRKHHCRACGGTFCQTHSSNLIALLDLGIVEPVRVCDNCFEDYDLKKNTFTKKTAKNNGGSPKTHRRKGSRKADSFDEEIQRAIELSLRESEESGHEPAAHVEPTHNKEPEKETPKNHKDEEEMDEDLKRAIELSLKEAEQQKASTHVENPVAATAVVPQPIYAQPQQTVFTPSPNEISAQEENDIYLFASLVEKLKTQPLHVVLQDAKLSQLYSNITNLKRKINLELQDTNRKYTDAIQMNGQISDIMNVYDQILESQLKSINIQQNNTLLQPSDPYSYYRQFEQPAQYTPPVQQAQPAAAKQTHQPVQQPVSHQLQDIVFDPEEAKSPTTTTVVEPLQESAPMEESAPYPKESSPEMNTTTNNTPYPITRVDFPTVPVSKPPVVNHKEEEEVEEKEKEEEEVVDEPMLIEL